MRNLAGALALVGLVAGLAASPAAAQDETADAAYRESVRDLMRTTGASDLGQQMIDITSQQMLSAMQGTSTRVPPRALEIAQEVISAAFSGIFGDEEHMLDLFVPIYRKHFTKAEIDEINVFYRSPVGRKAVRVMPAIVDEGMTIGAQLAQDELPRILEQVQRRLEEEGLVPRPSPRN